ncbi:hypothetical protein A2740_00715 [Candidatus Nomurabacteria bacterium RIFCSPHIGHO2_01_FULL_43_16]|nr:MAG: hypothetical protein A2740_00715 [Candidatus Nomurabacteria bacterium RIFCSPHIGHO2_01_FULL_43_16]OGI97503.1 MAG: hypothetical protein A3A11_02855 [Candidatus Nomurabacteria bacterium RIFCSPLOWO2_01_FULL_43_15]
MRLNLDEILFYVVGLIFWPAAVAGTWLATGGFERVDSFPALLFLALAAVAAWATQSCASRLIGHWRYVRTERRSAARRRVQQTTK